MNKRVADSFRSALLALSWCGIPVLAAASAAAANNLPERSPALRTSDEPLAEMLLHDTVGPSTPGSASGSKIRFDLGRLNADGLQGPPDGLRALHYEYCIADRPDAVRQVAAIDPTLDIQRGSPGRVGCGAGELLCLGHTHQPNHREILERLAALAIVTEIHEAFFE